MQTINFSRYKEVNMTDELLRDGQPSAGNISDEHIETSIMGSLQDDGDLTDMLGELRVLLPTAQLLSAFLITVPFSASFGIIAISEKWVFLATFVLSVSSLIFLSAPAVQHRLVRPLADRAKFKQLASRQIVGGAILLAGALVVATQLVLAAVFGHAVGTIVASFVLALLLLMWLVLPKLWRSGGHV